MKIMCLLIVVWLTTSYSPSLPPSLPPSPPQAASRQRRARPVVVVLDEMDYLVGKSLHTMEGKVGREGGREGRRGVNSRGGGTG